MGSQNFDASWGAPRIHGELLKLGIDIGDVVAGTKDQRIPEVACACVAALGAQLRALKAQILDFDRQIMIWHRSYETSKRLDEIPGVGPALIARIADPKAFRSGRDFSAWIGLVPKQHSSGGREKLGSSGSRQATGVKSLCVPKTL